MLEWETELERHNRGLTIPFLARVIIGQVLVEIGGGKGLERKGLGLIGVGKETKGQQKWKKKKDVMVRKMKHMD